MEVVRKETGEIFPSLKGKNIGKIILPYGVFDENDEDDQHLLTLVPKEDPAYRYPGSQLKIVLLAMQEAANLYITGPTGTGKTILAQMVAAKCNLPLTRVNCHGDMTSAELFGFWNVEGFQYSALTNGIKRPGVVLLDEVDTLVPETSVGMFRALEDNEPGIFIPELDEFIPRHPECIVIATGNTRGMGDASGLYAGTTTQNFAFVNRFHFILNIEPLNEKAIREIVGDYVVGGKKIRDTKKGTEIMDVMSKFYKLVLNAFEAEQLDMFLSVRTMCHYAKYFIFLGPEALEVVVLGKFPTEENRVIVKELAERLELVRKTD